MKRRDRAKRAWFRAALVAVLLGCDARGAFAVADAAVDAMRRTGAL